MNQLALDAGQRRRGGHVEADDALVFGDELADKWEMAIKKIGIDPRMLSDEAGHA